MNIKLTVTIIISKIVIKVLRLVKRGATTFPGKIARWIYPDVLSHISKGFKIIMVTGTNGKTTTARIIGQILTENKMDYITNKSGANLISGVITTFLESVDIRGRCTASTALIEVDEAAFNVIADYLEPDILVVTNFFRDQLDRYGELYTTLKGVQEGIQKSGKTKLILNSDDSLCASLGRNIQKEVIYYGINRDAFSSAEESANSDAAFCIYCKAKYEYSYHVYGHLGGFSCPGCGYNRPDASVACEKVDELKASYSQIRFSVTHGINSHISACILNRNKEQEKPDENTGNSGLPAENQSMGTVVSCPGPINCSYTARINLPGLYNIYNSLAAVACGVMLDFPIESILRALGSFECGFGRMETINTAGRTIKVILVKNPTGFNQVLSYLLTEDIDMEVAFIINDNLADGTDISWLWDVDFEKLQEIQGRLNNIYTSGTRAEDMAVRLKYAGIYANKITIQKDYKELINTGLSKTPEGHSFYILPTYTAMLDIRKVLKNKFGLKEFWK